MFLSADIKRRKVLVALLGSGTHNGLKRRRSHCAAEAGYDDIIIDDQSLAAKRSTGASSAIAPKLSSATTKLRSAVAGEKTSGSSAS